MKLSRSLRSNWITQRFGENQLPIYRQLGMKGHNGMDFYAREGEPLYWDCLDAEGLVVETHYDTRGGIGIVIVSKCADGYFKHIFWHLKSIVVKPNEIVSSGQLIGYADNTGRSTGTHLHRGLKRCDENWKTLNHGNGYFGAIDPEPFYQDIYIKKYTDLQKATKSIVFKLIFLFKQLIKRYE